MPHHRRREKQGFLVKYLPPKDLCQGDAEPEFESRDLTLWFMLLNTILPSPNVLLFKRCVAILAFNWRKSFDEQTF